MRSLPTPVSPRTSTLWLQSAKAPTSASSDFIASECATSTSGACGATSRARSCRTSLATIVRSSAQVKS
jgi:hypothetical protein